MTNFETEIQQKGYVAFTNKGDSMMPLLRQNRDIMVISKVTKPLEKYDAVLFKRPNGAYVLHRIVKVCGKGEYIISGDNRYFSETVPEEWIIGILSEVIRDGKHISVQSAEYKKYLRTLPIRRLRLKLIRFYHEFLKTVRKYSSAVKRRLFKQ